MLIAFNGKAETRTAALTRLGRRLESNRLTTGALFWNGQLASVAASLIDSDDAQSWQEELGLAKWLAYALDLGTGNLPPVKSVEIAAELLHAIAVGCDTSSAGSRVIVGVFLQVTASLRRSNADVAGLRMVADEIRRMHEQCAIGHTQSAAAWRSARKAATIATNAFEVGLEKALGTCIEAAAWDPTLAPTTVGDVLRLWNLACLTDLEDRFGWTPQDSERTQVLLNDMHEKFRKDKPEEDRDVFMLLREHHPEVEKRLLTYTLFQRAESERICAETAQLLTATLRNA
jgi:hypothetical protein